MVSMEVENLEILNGIIAIQSSTFKTVGPRGLPGGSMSFSKLPVLFDIVAAYVLARKKAGHKKLFCVKGRQACVFLAEALATVAR